jgi:hypothetical protein
MKETKEQLAEKYKKEALLKIISAQEGYTDGVNSAKKQIKKKLLDKLNHYKSQLKELTSAKLYKRVNQDKIRDLEIRIETLQQLL